MRQFVALQQRYEDRQKREDYRAGLIASIVANVNRDTKHQPTPWEWTEFFPAWKEPEPARGQTSEEMHALLMAWAKSRANN